MGRGCSLGHTWGWDMWEVLSEVPRAGGTLGCGEWGWAMGLVGEGGVSSPKGALGGAKGCVSGWAGCTPVPIRVHGVGGGRPL